MKEIKLPSGHLTIVDDDVYEWASKLNWHITNKGYARRGIWKNGGLVRWDYLHYYVIECQKGMMRDHVNGNRLDNRRENLRICTASQNARNRTKISKRNTTGYKGIRLEAGKRWRALIGVNGKKIHLGYFATPEEAAHAYDEAAKKYHGEFARTNF